MICACGQPVHIKKAGTCKRCYSRDRYRLKVGINPDNPLWKKKTAPNPLARIIAVERRAIYRINADRELIQHWRDGKSVSESARVLGCSRQNVDRKRVRWGIPTRTPKTPKPKAERTREEIDALKINRFWARVDQSSGESGCWPWLGGLLNYKNGQESRPKCYQSFIEGESATTYAYRVAFILAKGLIPKGLVIDHVCFNPLCCNPAHLRLLSLAENSARKDPKKIEARRLAKAAA